MYLPRAQIADLYQHLIRTTHPSSSPALVLTSLTVDSLCATRILTSLLKRDFIPHTIIPVSGYADLQRVGASLVLPLTRQRGGDGGTVICLGLGGTVALEEILGLDSRNEDGDLAEEGLGEHGVDVWVVDSHRPWNLENVFGMSMPRGTDDAALARRPGVHEGKILPGYKPGKGGMIVFDDGDLEAELKAEKEAYFTLQGMPEITEDDLALDDGDEEHDTGADADEEDEGEESSSGQKRKRSVSPGHLETDSESDGEDERPSRRRRSNSGDDIAIPSSPGGNPLSAQLDVTSTPPPMPSSPPRRKEPSAQQMRRQLLKLRREHESTLDKYYDRGSSGAEPVSSMIYALASELGRDDNELLWLSCVGVTSVTMSPSHDRTKLEQIRTLLQEDVTRLNPIPIEDLQRSQSIEGVIPTRARNAVDQSIKLSPEPRFLMIRHWSLYESMLHSPYLATRLHVWSESGQRRLNKLLAKMGISLQEARKGYLHMAPEVKQSLRRRILKYAEQYNLDGLVPGDNGARGKEGWGFVRSWGFQGTLSAEDVAIVVGAILEVGTDAHLFPDLKFRNSGPEPTYNTRVRQLATPPHSSDDGIGDEAAGDVPDFVTQRFFKAYDSLAPSKGLPTLMKSISSAQNLYKAILRVGSALISKKQIRHLRAFRMGVVKEGPDVPLFTHPGALVRLAAWVGEAVSVIEAEKGHRRGKNGNEALVLGCLDEGRSVYVVVGLGGGNGWSTSGKVRSKAEIKEREERKKRKEVEKSVKRAARAKKREERRQLRRERNAANGLDDSDFEESESEAETESDDSDSDSDSDSESEADGGSRRKTRGLNRFGQAFQQVVEETGARVRIDSFEHSVVEVKKEDLPPFLEALSLKTVVG